MTESQFIRTRCLGLIRKASMNERSWEMTILDGLHVGLVSRLKLEREEYPIISFLAGPGDWTVYTTHRLVGECDGGRTEIVRFDFGSCDFGNFKQDLGSPRVNEAVIVQQNKKDRFLYESGYASMAPIYYFRFWSIKWPVWRETYALERHA